MKLSSYLEFLRLGMQYLEIMKIIVQRKQVNRKSLRP